MNHYQADPYNALEAISAAQKIAFGPMLFQASWCLRETGVLAFLESRGQQGAPLAQIAGACELSEYAVSVLLAVDSATWPASTMCWAGSANICSTMP